MKPKIIDNFLPEYYHQALYEEIVESKNFPWFYIKDSAAYPKKINCNEVKFLENQSGFQHLAYKFGESSYIFSMIKPILGAIEETYDIEIKQLYRVRFGMSVRNGEIGQHFPHIDMRESHKTFLYYLNDSDGDTVFYNEFFQGEDPENLTVLFKNKPIKNQGVLFNGHQYHSSGVPFQNYDRITMNINFI